MEALRCGIGIMEILNTAVKGHYPNPDDMALKSDRAFSRVRITVEGQKSKNAIGVLNSDIPALTVTNRTVTNPIMTVGTIYK